MNCPKCGHKFMKKDEIIEQLAKLLDLTEKERQGLFSANKDVLEKVLGGLKMFADK